MKLEQELVEYQKLGGHPLAGRRSPAKPKAPSFMRRPQQPTQKKSPAKKLPVARKLSEEELDELSLDTIKEIEPGQEQSRANTHRGPGLAYDFVEGSIIQEVREEQPSYEFNSQIESVLQHRPEKSFGEPDILQLNTLHQRKWSSSA